MQSKVTTAAELLALFAAKATVPPPETSLILVRHFQCKESLAAAQYLSEAMNRNAAGDGQPLQAPTVLLPPLG
jgi:hypothetical protein